MIEDPKDKKFDHRCFCRGNPLLGKVGNDYYEFRNSHPPFFIRFYGEGKVEVECKRCYRIHKYFLHDLREKLKKEKNLTPLGKK